MTTRPNPKRPFSALSSAALTLLIILSLGFAAGAMAAQATSNAMLEGVAADASERRIVWIGGDSTLPVQSPAEMTSAIDEIARSSARHLIVQLDRPADQAARGALADAGIELLDYLGNNAYFAGLAPERLNGTALSNGRRIRAAQPIMREFKLHPLLLRGDIPDWIVVQRDAAPQGEPQTAADPVVAAYVLLQKDVDAASAITALCDLYDATLRSRLRTVNGFVIELPYSAIAALADEDAVQWIEPALPRLSETNDSNRLITQAETAQAPPYSLSGDGVTVLVYDVGVVDETHPDFAGRLTVGDGAGVSDHSTHVAGSVGGDGHNSAGLYRGMAPAVGLLSYAIGGGGTGLPLYSDPGDLESDYFQALHLYGFDIATNSIGTNTCRNGFSCDITGNYGVTSAVIDGIVHGGLGQPLTVLFANGNERNCQRCRDEGVHTPEGYHSTAPPACAKNHISVGALNSDDDSVTFFTSWGPTDDGRLKPDVCGPGCQLTDDEGVTSTVPGGGYLAHCGTSMATPTVAGLCALLLEDLHTRHPERNNPLNSTLKILLAHNARDLGNPGPDYQSGYGSVRIADTIDFARLGYFYEQSVDQNDAYTFLLRVQPGESELKITLAWDDVPGTANVVNALINDLDLVVLNPAQSRHYPWTLRPQNPSALAVRNQADHLNVIEQVFVTDPMPGLWTVQVLGYNVPQGPQKFSICGSPRLALDCDGNQIPDDEEIANDPSLDCTGNGVLDVCEPDCNGNTRADSCDLADGTSTDCDDNGVPDECQPDCNASGRADACDILQGFSDDCDDNGVPDECQDTSADCNDNGVWDACDIADGASLDLNFNWIPDECEQPRILYVDDDAPNDPQPGNAFISDPAEDGSPEHPFDGIQEAIDAALAGDTIIVADGLYTRQRNTALTFGGKNLILRSANGPEDCVIDGEGSYRGFSFVHGETAAARIEGLTIHDGFDGFWGGGLFCENSSPTIVNCVFFENWGVVGGAIYLRDSSPVIRDCEFTDNFGGYGGGMFITGEGTPLIVNCDFSGNLSLLGGAAATLFGTGLQRMENCAFDENDSSQSSNDNAEGGALLISGSVSLRNCRFRDNRSKGGGGGAYIRVGGSATMTNCVFVNNLADGSFSDGGALAMIDAAATLTGCTFLDNQAEHEGGGILWRYDSRLTLLNCVLWNNTDRDGDAESAQLNNQGMYPDVRYCCIQNYSGLYGAGTINAADPLFVNQAGGDYHLRPESPYINAGDPAFLPLPDETDLDGDSRVLLGRVDIGADEFRYIETDCNENGTLDVDEIAADPALDCNGNGILDECELRLGFGADCNGNGVLDACDLISGTSTDCGNLIPDECDPDCNGNGVSDDCDIASGDSADCDADWIPDECEADCNANGRADACDLLDGTSEDFNHNGVPDECEENRVLRVDDDAPNDPGPGDPSLSDELEDGGPDHPYDAIQKAIDAAISGDVVLVADGLYWGVGNKNLELRGRQATIQSSGGPLRCIIDCQDYGRGFMLGQRVTADTLVEGFTVTNGSYSVGGGMYLDRCSAIVRRCILVGNVSWSTTASGAGILLSNASATVENCLIVGNSGATGGGLAIQRENTPQIINCTIVNNEADDGGGVSCGRGAAPIIANSILWGNAATNGAQLRCAGANTNPTVAYCDLQGGAASVYVDEAANFTWADGNLDAEPRFLTSREPFWNGQWTAEAVYDPDSHTTVLYDDDAAWTANELADKFLQPSLDTLAQALIVSNTASTITVWGEYDSLGLPGVEYRIHDYHVLNCSPVIDAGDNDRLPAAPPLDADLDGRPRTIDDPFSPDLGAGTPPIVDLGVYEYPADCHADLTGDRFVDWRDLVLLLQDYGGSEQGDLNCDGMTNLSDLAAMLSAYGKDCP